MLTAVASDATALFISAAVLPPHSGESAPPRPLNDAAAAHERAPGLLVVADGGGAETVVAPRNALHFSFEAHHVEIIDATTLSHLDGASGNDTICFDRARSVSTECCVRVALSRPLLFDRQTRVLAADPHLPLLDMPEACVIVKAPKTKGGKSAAVTVANAMWGASVLIVRDGSVRHAWGLFTACNQSGDVSDAKMEVMDVRSQSPLRDAFWLPEAAHVSVDDALFAKAAMSTYHRASMMLRRRHHRFALLGIDGTLQIFSTLSGVFDPARVLIPIHHVCIHAGTPSLRSLLRPSGMAAFPTGPTLQSAFALVTDDGDVFVARFPDQFTRDSVELKNGGTRNTFAAHFVDIASTGFGADSSTTALEGFRVFCPSGNTVTSKLPLRWTAADKICCPACNEPFARSNDMQRHFLTVHAGKNEATRSDDFAAELQKYQKSGLSDAGRRHESNRVPERPAESARTIPEGMRQSPWTAADQLTCPLCNDSFANTGNMRRHFLNIHAGIRNTNRIDDFVDAFNKYLQDLDVRAAAPTKTASAANQPTVPTPDGAAAPPSQPAAVKDAKIVVALSDERAGLYTLTFVTGACVTFTSTGVETVEALAMAYTVHINEQTLARMLLREPMSPSTPLNGNAHHSRKGQSELVVADTESVVLHCVGTADPTAPPFSIVPSTLTPRGTCALWTAHVPTTAHVCEVHHVLSLTPRFDHDQRRWTYDDGAACDVVEGAPCELTVFTDLVTGSTPPPAVLFTMPECIAQVTATHRGPQTSASGETWFDLVLSNALPRDLVTVASAVADSSVRVGRLSALISTVLAAKAVHCDTTGKGTICSLAAKKASSSAEVDSPADPYALPHSSILVARHAVDPATDAPFVAELDRFDHMSASVKAELKTKSTRFRQRAERVLQRGEAVLARAAAFEAKQRRLLESVAAESLARMDVSVREMQLQQNTVVMLASSKLLEDELVSVRAAKPVGQSRSSDEVYRVHDADERSHGDRRLTVVSTTRHDQHTPASPDAETNSRVRSAEPTISVTSSTDADDDRRRRSANDAVVGGVFGGGMGGFDPRRLVVDATAAGGATISPGAHHNGWFSGHLRREQ